MVRPRRLNKQKKMKKLSSIIVVLAAVMMPLAFTACSDSDDYSPASPISDNCPGVYFDSTNVSAKYVTPMEAANDPSVKLTLSRPDSVGELTVPIVVDKKTDGTVVPENVTFSDGDTTTTLVIGYDPEQGMNAIIHVGDGYANPYLKQGGTTTFTVSVDIIETVCSVTYSSDGKTDRTGRFANETSYICNISRRNEFLWKDFLGSGIDVRFSINLPDTITWDADNINKMKGTINLLDHKLDYYSGGYWFILDDNGDWPSWTPEGQTEEISYPYLYDGVYSSIDFGNYNDGYWSGYFYFGFQVNGAWKLDGSGYLYFYFHFD